MHKIQSFRGFAPEPHWGSYRALPDSLAGTEGRERARFPLPKNLSPLLAPFSAFRTWSIAPSGLTLCSIPIFFVHNDDQQSNRKMEISTICKSEIAENSETKFALILEHYSAYNRSHLLTAKPHMRHC